MVETWTFVLPRALPGVRFIFFGPLLYHPIGGEGLFSVLPAIAALGPEPGVEAIPVVVESQDVAAVVGPTGQCSRLSGEHGQVMSVGDIGIAPAPVVTLVYDGKRHTAPEEPVEVLVGAETVSGWQSKPIRTRSCD